MGPLKNPEPEKNQEKKGVQPGSGPPERIWFFSSKFRQATKDMPPDEVSKLVEEFWRYADRQMTEYAEVLAHAVDTFGSRINANAWLNKPNRVFHNQSPLQILTEDPGAVEEELVRIDHGMFI
jgi:uncharacterized protein (DUF2384 family)